MKKIIITGTSGLLGDTFARTLLDTGYEVHGIDISDSSQIEHRNFYFWKANLFDIPALLRLIATIKDKHGLFWGLVNNAAYNPQVERGELVSHGIEESPEVFAEIQFLNAISPTYLSRYFCDFLVDTTKGGRVVNIASTYGLVPPNQSIYEHNEGSEIAFKPLSYSMSKSSIIMMTKWFSVHPLYKHVAFNALAPGGVDNGQSREFTERYCALTPLGRMASPEEISSGLVFLLSDGASYVRGQTLAIDGGWTVW